MTNLLHRIYHPVKYHCFIINILSLCPLFLLSCSLNPKIEQKPEQFPVIRPILADTSVTTDYVADIHALQNVDIRSRVKGYLDKIYVDEGKFVKQGQMLFCISNQEYRQELLKAQAALKSAIADIKTSQLELQNIKILVGNNIVSKTELEIAQAKLDALYAKEEEAKANVSSATLNLSYTLIKAPFDGILNRIPNKAGSLIEEGTLLTTISNNEEIYAYFNVSEKEYLSFIKEKELNKKKEAKLILADNQEYPYTGIIETVEGEIDRNTGNIAYRARFNNPEKLIKHGASGKILLSKKIENALIIPQKSTFEIQEKTYVFVVDNNNVVQMRSVNPKLRLPHFFILESGLSISDRILYEGIQQVKEGDKIVPQEEPAIKLIAQEASRIKNKNSVN